MRIGSRKSLISGSVSFDSDALAYFEAAGISNAAEKIAVNNLFVGLKSRGLWDECIRVYLVSPTSLDAASYCAKTLIQGSFVNSPTHSSTGVVFDGATNYFLINDSRLNSWMSGRETDASFGLYNRQDLPTTTTNFCLAGAGAFGTDAEMYNFLRLGNQNIEVRCFEGSSGVTLGPGVIPDINNTVVGFYCNSRSGSTTHAFYKNGALVSDGITASTTVPNANLAIGGRRSSGGAVTLLAPFEWCFFWAGYALSESQQFDLYTLVQAYQTSLGRQV